jgi:hypothetical protein
MINKSTINKVTYELNGLFTLRKYKQGNLCHESYSIPMLSTLRSAIIGAIIKIDGLEKARELFYKVKNEVIYIQLPQEYSTSNQRLRRCSNSWYKKDTEDIIENWQTYQTMGCKQFIIMNEIVFYIGNNIPNIELYLKNIDWIGSAESLVYLKDFNKTDTIENGLTQWNEIEDTDIYEVYDWGIKTEFDNIYMFSDKKSFDTYSRKLCCTKNIILPSDF